MKPNFYPEDRNNLTVNEEIELLKVLNEVDLWPGDAEIEELDLSEDYYD